MQPKATAAVFQLLAHLEARYAMRVLLALSDGHAQTFRVLQDSVGGITPNTLNTRLKEMREIGWITHGTDGYRLTHQGQDLARHLNELGPFATRWLAARKRANSGI